MSTADWLHKTKTGRVVYQRTPHLFSGKDVVRVFKGWLWYTATRRDIQAPEPAEILEVVWSILQEAFLEILRSVGPWVLDVVREVLNRILSALFNLISADNATGMWLIGKVISDFGKSFMETAALYGGSGGQTEGTESIQDFIKEEL